MSKLIAKLTKRKKIVKRIPIVYDEDIVEINTITKGNKYNFLKKDVINGTEMILVIDDINNESWFNVDCFVI